MNIEALSIPGLQLLHLFHSADDRGDFVKTYHAADFKKMNLGFEIKECFYSTSRKNVIRGMHFQLPPSAHDKLVFCSQGAILDVVLDLRKSSPTYLQFVSVELHATKPQALLIPAGCAHGFKSLADHTITNYFVSSEYDASADAGIHYQSFGFDWDCADPIVSTRDQSFPAINVFQSPF